MKGSYVALMAVVFFSLSACRSNPVYEYQTGIPPVNGGGNGRVMIGSFQMPKEEAGVKLFYFAAALSGAHGGIPYAANVYDVTDGIEYVGLVSQGGSPVIGEWLSYDAPAGKRLLMLYSGNNDFSLDGFGNHVDFIEVEVRPGKRSYVVVSQHGYSKKPYFGLIRIAEEHQDFCIETIGRGGRNDIRKYMEREKIDSTARDFLHFCERLSPRWARVRVPTDLAFNGFAEKRHLIEVLRKEGYAEWVAREDKLAPYDLMRLYPAGGWTNEGGEGMSIN